MATVSWYEAESKKKAIDNNPAYTQYVLKDEPTTFEADVYSPETLKKISDIITRSLNGVDPQGRKIVVGDNVICSVLNNIIQSSIPRSGDIYSKYQIMYNDPRNDADEIIKKTIEVITNQIRTETGMIECNQKLNIWDTLLGDFNEKGLQAHPQIKLRNRRPDPFLFHMKY